MKASSSNNTTTTAAFTYTDNTHKVTLFNGLWVNDLHYNTRILLVMIAIEILMAYSPFGYIVLPTISITTLYISVMMGALWGGPLSGAVIGLVFGLTSMWKASVTGTSSNDLLFSPVRSGDPAGSIILALGPRILFGIIAGLVYYAIRRWASRRWQLPLVLMCTVILERVHSMLTYHFMDIIFHVEGISAFKSLHHLLSANRLQTYAIAVLFVLAAWMLYDHFLSKEYYRQFALVDRNINRFNLKHTFIFLIALFILYLTITHLWDSIGIILFDIDEFNTAATSMDLFIQVFGQFIAAALSSFYVVMAIYCHARNYEELERSRTILQRDREASRANLMELRSLKDPLTGIYNRNGLEKIVADEKLAKEPVIFILIDIDRFKEFNDSFGHNAGDRVLSETASELSRIFGRDKVFRMGGDEFAAMICGDELKTSEDMLNKWHSVTNQLLNARKAISGFLDNDTVVTLSMGGCFSESGYSSDLYPLADKALYKTKRNGRAGSTLIDVNDNDLHSQNDPVPSFTEA